MSETTYEFAARRVEGPHQRWRLLVFSVSYVDVFWLPVSA